MTRTMKILTLLAVMAITAGQVWAGVDYDLGHIIYTQGANDGGELKFYHNSDCLENSDEQFDNGKSRYKLSSEELTDRTVYIKATPDFGYSGINVEFTAEESIGSGAAEAPRRHAPGVGQNVTVTAVEGKPGIYQFTMPSNGNNVTISATFPEKAYLTGVNYMDLSAEYPQKTTAEGTKVWVLDGTEWTVGKDNTETWCVCNSNLDYNHILNIKGDIHLILADGAEMSVTSTDTNYGYAVGTNSSSIAIYGQTLGTGMLSAIGKDHGIFASNGNVTINHCKVTATGSSYGIYATPWDSNCGVTINGSEVSATSTLGNGIHAGYITISNSKVTANGKSDGFFAAAQSVSITGGEVNVTGSSEGIYAKSNITINNCETKVQGNYGLHTGGGNISITGGELTATGIGSESYAVQASGSGTITLSNCTANVTGSYGIYTSYRSVSITGGELTATCKLGISGNVTLDGAKVTLDCTEGTTGIQGNSCSITNNAIVNVTAKEEGIVIWGPFTMDSGQLTTTATSTGTNVHGLRANTVTITGGQVTATGATYGILATSGDITLGWTNATDYINASSFKLGSSNAVKTADSKPMIAYIPASDNTPEKQAVLIQGKEGGMTLTTNAVAAIAGKVLRPATADDVTVSYMDWDDTEKMLVSKNTATDNVADNDIVYVLQGGGATTLPSGWYVAKDEVSYTGGLTLNGDAHLILADGCNMTVGTEDSPIGYEAIDCSANMKIYSQSIGDDMGSLSAHESNNFCSSISVYNDLTINGGKVKVTANGTNSHKGICSLGGNITINDGKIIVDAKGINGIAIDSQGNVSINGGQVTATYNAELGGHCAITASSDIYLNGGQVTANGGTHTNNYCIYAVNGNITLGGTNPTDFINASSYCGTVKTADGKRFIAYNMASDDDISANCIIGSTTGETTLNDTDLGNIAGKTLRPLDGYYVKDEAGLTFYGKTNDDGSAKPDFTITTDAGTENEVTTPYYIYKASTTEDPVSVVVSVTGHVEDHMEITTTPAVNQTDDEAFSHCFAMPAQDVTITGIKYYNYGVDYMDWNDTQKKLVSATSPENTKVWHLPGGGATTLTDDWYVAKGEVSYTGKVKFSGNAHLILADGANMTINTTDNDADAIFSSKSLTIYGQSIGKAMGKLNAHSEKQNGIMASNNASGVNITINGGQVTATSGSYDGICACTTVVDANKDGYATLTINGGQVTATGGTNGKGINATSESSYATITLNLTNGSDFVKASSYSTSVVNGTVKIPAGKALAYTDGDITTVLGSTDADYIFGETGNATLASIANLTLRPSKNMPASAVKTQYAALYQEDGDWKVKDADIKMYVPTGKIIKNENTYEMELQEVTGGGIPNGVPVIASKEGGLTDIPVVGTSTDEANAIETSYNDTESAIEQKHKDEHTEQALTLFATNTTETLAQQIINAASQKDDQGNVIEETKVDPKDYVVLGIVKGKLTMLSANQAAVPSSIQPVVVISKFDLLQMIRGTYATSDSNAPSIIIDLGDVTGVKEVREVKDNSWYTLDGRKLEKAPTKKGLYIRNGKVVVK